MNDEWLLAAAICAVPFLIFGAIELLGRMRRRRMAAIARRTKAPMTGRPKADIRGRPAGSFGGAD